ncbi:MAG: hypothetical protein KGH78_04035 [Candidatus Micrarchaeota archaeon]|nr:hypothetical protein [Candidatus Micrarchaeota archaeon]MDE1846766.1 hypothetical protein [Candidatus Micrarchaeota archaeon]
MANWKHALIALLILFAVSDIGIAFAQTPPPPPPGGSSGSIVGTFTSELCGIVSTVRTVIGIIALVMFLIGGVLYAVGHFMPAAGNVRAGMQGWAMGMILGAVIGVILVILAPFIISTVLNFGSGLSGLGACG